MPITHRLYMKIWANHLRLQYTYMKDGINNSKSNVRTLKLAKGATKNENANVMLHWLFRRVILTIIISKDINVSTNSLANRSNIKLCKYQCMFEQEYLTWPSFTSTYQFSSRIYVDLVSMFYWGSWPYYNTYLYIVCN